jgi:hypothetical protein
LLVISDRIAILEWLREADPKYEFRITNNIVNIKNYSTSITSNNCHNYKIVNGELVYQETTSDEIIQMSNLCRSWHQSYIIINKSINNQRNHLGAMWSFQLQNVIYQEKVKEAEQVLSDDTVNLKFLPSEAGYKNIPIKELANRIIIEHEVAMGFLARTENLRVKWLDKLKSSVDILEHTEIIVGFKRELYEYHLLS